ncbi:hypothetical protein [Streptomyces sp. DASNCL29]|uniref:hypothetical protein n=1 Tax=Streptomyces sp. DASNCL29 TaxID=2583819 RepID=UPI001485D966|nr:hypothetical protein [Streptomyces sp. DASNCL29]
MDEVDDGFEEQRVARGEPHPGADEDRVVALAVEHGADGVQGGLPEVDLAAVRLVSGVAQQGEVVVVGGAQRLPAQTGEGGELGRLVVDGIGVEPDLDG